jgi:hypothetical protein
VLFHTSRPGKSTPKGGDDDGEDGHVGWASSSKGRATKNITYKYNAKYYTNKIITIII